MGILLEAKGICRDFQVGTETINVLKNISFGVEKGSISILKGRSGSGKTTLINILGIIDKPTKGEVFIYGNEMNKMKEKEKNNFRQNKIGYVFQSGALIPNMTVYENVELTLRLKKVPHKERRDRVEESIEKVGLIKKINRYTEELSGGELQRIGIARAIVHKPEIIIADEPTSALDYNTGASIAKLFKRLVKNEGCTFIIATHDNKLLPIADRVLNIMDGEIIDE